MNEQLQLANHKKKNTINMEHNFVRTNKWSTFDPLAVDLFQFYP